MIEHRVRLHVPVPLGWHEMPATSDPSSGAWADRLATTLATDPGHQLRLAASLRAAQERAAQQQVPGRWRLVSVGEPPARSVRAWAFVDAVPRPADCRTGSPADAATSVATTLADPAHWRGDAHAVRVERRTVDVGALGGGIPDDRAPGRDDPAVLVDEVLRARAGAQDVLQRRVIALRFVDAPWLIRVTASTPHFLQYPALDAIVRGIAAGIREDVHA